jgi:hypothetical protein
MYTGYTSTTAQDRARWELMQRRAAMSNRELLESITHNVEAAIEIATAATWNIQSARLETKRAAAV